MINLTEIAVTNPAHQTEYPYCSPLYRKGFTLPLTKNIVFLVGDNGVGKSTLLESVAAKVGFPITGGTADHILRYMDFSRAFQSGLGMYTTFDEDMSKNRDTEQTIDDLTLQDNIKLTWRLRSKKGMFLRSETFFTMTNLGRLGADNVSHGEGIINVLSSIEDNGLYLLDEPEAGLSPAKSLEFLSIMRHKANLYGAQFIISTHSPLFICLPDTQLFLMTETDIGQTSFDATPHYQIAKRILSNPVDFFAHFLQE